VLIQFYFSRCVPTDKDHNHTHNDQPSSQIIPNAVTITISISVPVLKGNQTNSLSPDDISVWLVKAFEDALNSSEAENITVLVAGKHRYYVHSRWQRG